MPPLRSKLQALSQAIGEAAKVKPMRPEEYDAMLRTAARNSGRDVRPFNPDPETQTVGQRFNNSFAQPNKTGGYDFLESFTSPTRQGMHQVAKNANIETPQSLGEKHGMPWMGMFDPINMVTDPATIMSAGLLGGKALMGRVPKVNMQPKMVDVPMSELPAGTQREVAMFGNKPGNRLNLLGYEDRAPAGTRGFSPGEQYGPNPVTERMVRNMFSQKEFIPAGQPMMQKTGPLAELKGLR